MSFNFTGFKTILVGLVMAIGPGALTYLGGIDWAKLGLPDWAAFAISGAIMIAMRFKTSTPVFKPNAVAAVAAMPDPELRAAGVARILTTPTIVGKALADLTPGEVVIQSPRGS